MNNFEQKNYLIFAGTSTIGQDLIKHLHQFDANIIFTSRDQEKAQKVADEYDCEFIICQDLANFDEVEKAYQSAQEKLGHIDGVVNFSGSINLKSAHQTSFDEYIDIIHKNLTSSFAIVRGAGKYIKNNGSVILMSSIAASMGIANHEAISAAKSGIEGLVKSAACTYASKNIRFNAVAPSLTRTNLSKMITSNEMMLQASVKMHSLGRIGNAQDISSACLFLLNPQNNWITGQVIKVEGGFALKSKATL